jgi:hypothetical protein
MEHKDATYERLRNDVSALEPAPDGYHRQLHWVVDEMLAVARNEASCIEVFVVGDDPLQASIRVVSDLLEHEVWSWVQGQLPAARIVLPRGEHFDQLAALLCVELIDNDLEEHRQEAFSAVEPLLALALSRRMVGDPVLNGLVGELALLRRLLLAAIPAARHDVLESWAGSTPSARDFQLGSIGLEVKTTQASVSTHHVSGVHQIERGQANGGGVETHLFLLSLGIEWLEAGNGGASLPELVDSVLTLVPDPSKKAELLARIKQYGGDVTIGYDHVRDHAKGRYAGRFHFRFERLYDMCDDRLELLTSNQLIGLRNIDPASVEFRVVLPDKVHGDLNPVTNWDKIVPTVVGAGGLLLK